MLNATELELINVANLTMINFPEKLTTGTVVLLIPENN